MNVLKMKRFVVYRSFQLKRFKTLYDIPCEVCCLKVENPDDSTSMWKLYTQIGEMSDRNGIQYNISVIEWKMSYHLFPVLYPQFIDDMFKRRCRKFNGEAEYRTAAGEV